MIHFLLSLSISQFKKISKGLMCVLSPVECLLFHPAHCRKEGTTTEMWNLSAVMHSLQCKTPFNEWIDCTGHRQGGLGDSCSCTNWSSHKGKQHLGFRTENYAPTNTRNDHPMVVKNSLEPSVQKLLVPRKASSAQFSLFCLHKLIQNKGTIFALPDNSAVAKAGVWLPFLGPHGQGT